MYRPVVYRFARSRGLQHSDAEALVAEVLARVFRAAQRWSSDSESGGLPDRFRSWLYRVAQNALLNLVTRQIARCGTGGTSHHLSLAGRPVPDTDSQLAWEFEYQRQLFATAANRMQSQVDPDHWTIFWQSHVEGVAIGQIAKQTSRTVGSIYAIRSRILRKLREVVDRLQALDEPGSVEVRS